MGGFLTPREVFAVACTRKENLIKILKIDNLFISAQTATFLPEYLTKKLENSIYRRFPEHKSVMVQSPACNCFATADFIVPFPFRTLCSICDACISAGIGSDLKFFRVFESIKFFHFGALFFYVYDLPTEVGDIQVITCLHSVGDVLHVVEDVQNEVVFCAYRHDEINRIGTIDASGKRKKREDHRLLREPNVKTAEIAQRLKTESLFRGR